MFAFDFPLPFLNILHLPVNASSTSLVITLCFHASLSTMLSNHTISSIKAASLFGPNQVSIVFPLAIFRNLLCADFVHRIAGWRCVEDFIPLGRHLQAFVYGEDAVPVKLGVGLVTVQFVPWGTDLKSVPNFPSPQYFINLSAISATVRWLLSSGPKFQAPEYFCGSCHRAAPSCR
jgi:hypothetical protein